MSVNSDQKKVRFGNIFFFRFRIFDVNVNLNQRFLRRLINWLLFYTYSSNNNYICCFFQSMFNASIQL